MTATHQLIHSGHVTYKILVNGISVPMSKSIVIVSPNDQVDVSKSIL